MQKIIAGPACAGALDIDAPVEDNLKAIAGRLDRKVKDLVVMVLDRPRHEQLIRDIRAAGARIRLIGDGDLSAGIAAAVRGAGVHAVMGIGGAPEGVLTAAAMRCLYGEMVARLVVDSPELEARMERMGIQDPHRVYRAEDARELQGRLSGSGKPDVIAESSAGPGEPSLRAHAAPAAAAGLRRRAIICRTVRLVPG